MTRNQKIIAAVVAVVVLARRGHRVRRVERVEQVAAGEVVIFSTGAGADAAEHGGPERDTGPQADPQHHRRHGRHRQRGDRDQRLDGDRRARPCSRCNGRDAIAETGTRAVLPVAGAGRPGRRRAAAEADPRRRGRRPGPHEQLLFTSRPSSPWRSGRPSTTIRTRPRPIPQSVTVSLQQGTGYKLGTQSAAGLIIGPPAAQTTSVDVRRAASPHGDASPAYRPIPPARVAGASRSSRWTTRCPRASRPPS